MMKVRKFKSIIKNLVLFAALLFFLCSNVLTAFATEAEADVEAAMQGDQTEDSFSPRQAWLELVEYSVEDGLLSPGVENVLTLKFKNLSKLSAARGVSINISNGAELIYPAYGTDNQVYIGRIEPDSEQSVQIPIMVSAGLSVDTVTIDISISLAIHLQL